MEVDRLYEREMRCCTGSSTSALITDYYPSLSLSSSVSCTTRDESAFEKARLCVEAEKRNCNSNFLREFIMIAHAACHRVIIHTASTHRTGGTGGGNECLQSNVSKDLMLKAALIPPEELDDIKLRIFDNEASEDDKWRMYKHSYLMEWGIDDVDKAFLDTFGTLDVATTAAQLTRILIPGGAGVYEERSVRRGAIVIDIITAMGLLSPFDSTAVDLMEVFNQVLKKHVFFKNYNELAPELFNPNSHIEGEWDLAKVARSIRMVLNTVGLNLVSTRKQTRESSTPTQGKPWRGVS